MAFIDPASCIALIHSIMGIMVKAFEYGKKMEGD